MYLLLRILVLSALMLLQKKEISIVSFLVGFQNYILRKTSCLSSKGKEQADPLFIQLEFLVLSFQIMLSSFYS